MGRLKVGASSECHDVVFAQSIGQLGVTPAEYGHIVSQREVPTVCISDPPLPGLIDILLGTNVRRHLSKVNVTPDQIQQFASSPFPSPLIPPGLCELTLDSQEFGGQHYSGAEEGL